MLYKAGQQYIFQQPYYEKKPAIDITVDLFLLNNPQL